MTCQSWRSERIALLASCLLSKIGFESVWGRIFFWTSNFERSHFCSPLPMIMKRGSFGSPKSYLFLLKNYIAALFRCIILAQTNPIYEVICKKVQFFCKPLYALKHTPNRKFCCSALPLSPFWMVSLMNSP